MVWYGVVGKNGQKTITSEPTLPAGPKYDIETGLVWFGMVKMAKIYKF